MSVENVAKRLSKEHYELDVVMKKMLDCVEFMPRTNEANWIEQCRGVFAEFREHILKHMALEEDGGYMSEITERRPRLSGEVERLLREHGSIRQLLDSLDAAVSKLSAEEPLLIRDCCHRIRDLISYARHHEHDENMMVLSAFTDDIGTKD